MRPSADREYIAQKQRVANKTASAESGRKGLPAGPTAMLEAYVWVVFNFPGPIIGLDVDVAMQTRHET